MSKQENSDPIKENILLKKELLKKDEIWESEKKYLHNQLEIMKKQYEKMESRQKRLIQARRDQMEAISKSDFSFREESKSEFYPSINDRKGSHDVHDTSMKSSFNGLVSGSLFNEKEYKNQRNTSELNISLSKDIYKIKKQALTGKNADSKHFYLGKDLSGFTPDENFSRTFHSSMDYNLPIKQLQDPNEHGKKENQRISSGRGKNMFDLELKEWRHHLEMKQERLKRSYFQGSLKDKLRKYKLRVN